jgi:hypothetical protein
MGTGPYHARPRFGIRETAAHDRRWRIGWGRAKPSSSIRFTRFAGDVGGYYRGMTNADAILQGGPCDGDTHQANGAGLIEVEIEGMVHRYIPTTQRLGDTGSERAVYTYDGMINPRGGEDGAEKARDRLASPRADDSTAEASPP